MAQRPARRHPTAAATRFTDPDRTSPIGEDAATAGAQRIALVAGVGTGQDEAARIQLHARSLQPIGVRLSANEGKEVAAPGPRSRYPSERSRKRNRSSWPSSPASPETSAPHDVRHWQAFDPFDQILGHGPA
jgi:hypothetical protein